MAILEKGSNGFRGKLGNTVTYNLKGQSVQRLIGEITKPPTEPQLINRRKMAIVTEFLKPVKKLSGSDLNLKQGEPTEPK